MYTICGLITTVLILENILIFVVVTQRRGDGYVQVEEGFAGESPALQRKSIEGQLAQVAEAFAADTKGLQQNKTLVDKRAVVALETVGTVSPKGSSNKASPSEVALARGANSSKDKLEGRKRMLPAIEAAHNRTSKVSRQGKGGFVQNTLNSSLHTKELLKRTRSSKKGTAEPNIPWSLPENITPVPPNIASLFPVNMTDTTLLRSGPPRNPPFSFQEFAEVLTDKSINILDLLARWKKITLPFFSKEAPPLRFPGSYLENNPPNSSICNQPSEFKRDNWTIVECLNKIRETTQFEKNGNHILFTLRTTTSFHSTRLPLLFQTWLANVNRTNVVIVTDSLDPVLQYRAEEAGLRALISVPGYQRLCEKAGDEVSLMFLPENKHYEWFCHVDDDMYVNLEMLVDVLARLKRDKPVYFGRSGSYPGKPRRVMKESKIGTPGTPYNFAVGGMYCLNRVFLNMARRWIGGRDAFKKMCSLVKEPEDVTVGIVAAILLGLDISHTELIRSHGLELYYADPTTLKYQIAISYGYGMVHWGSNPHNVVPVPKHLFTITEDPSQFLSLHCHYHSAVGWCANKLARVHKGQRASSQVHKPSSNSLPL
jgi:fringe protein